MIITKDMLEAKGFCPSFLDVWEDQYPQGFDFSKPNSWNTNIVAMPIDNLACLFSYSGLVTYQYREKYNHFTIQTNYVNGCIQDFPNGNPGSVAIFNNTGKLSDVWFYLRGRQHNPAKDIPAHIGWNEDGLLNIREFKIRGVLNNPYDNVPAILSYYSNGNIYTIRHYKDGKLHDPPNGKEAYVMGDEDGYLISATHYKNGISI